jgi:hypothetical protein
VSNGPAAVEAAPPGPLPKPPAGGADRDPNPTAAARRSGDRRVG